MMNQNDSTNTKSLIDRRSMIAAAAAAAVTSSTAHALAQVIPPLLEFVFEASVTLGKPFELGGDISRRNRFIPITGGTVTGPRLDGIVIGGGGDWQEIGSNGVTAIHARYMLRAKDGTPISVDNPGVRVASTEIIARLTAGEDLDPSLYYFRTTPSFQVGSGPHDWLLRSVFICQGIRHPEIAVLRFFRVS